MLGAVTKGLRDADGRGASTDHRLDSVNKRRARDTSNANKKTPAQRVMDRPIFATSATEHLYLLHFNVGSDVPRWRIVF